MSSHDKDEATKFFDRMGEAAKQLSDALIELIKQYAKKQEEQKAGKLQKVNKMLKDAGFEQSPENAKALQAHLDKVDKIQEQQVKIEKRMQQLGGQKSLNDDQKAEMQKLEGQHAALEIEKEDLFKSENLPDLKPDKMRQALKQKAEQPKVAEAAKVEEVDNVELAPEVGEIVEANEEELQVQEAQVADRQAEDVEVAAVKQEEAEAEAEAVKGEEVDAEAEAIDAKQPELPDAKIADAKVAIPDAPALKGPAVKVAPAGVGPVAGLSNAANQLGKSVGNLAKPEGMDINTMTRQNRSNSVGATLKSQGYETAKVSGPGIRLRAGTV